MDREAQILLDAFGLGAIESDDGTAPASTPRAFAEGQTTADKALIDLANMYRRLQLQAGRIMTFFGASAPCDVIGRHHDSVQKYVDVAGRVFQQLTRQGFVVVQQTYNINGEKTGEQLGSTPVVPADFAPCASSAATGALSGWGGVIINLGVVDTFGALPVVAVVVMALMANGTTVAVPHTIVVDWPALATQVEANGIWMENYLACIERSSGTRPQADASCRGLSAPLAPFKLPAVDFRLLLVGGFLVLGGVAAFLLWQAYKRDNEDAPDAFEPEPERARLPSAATAGVFADSDELAEDAERDFIDELEDLREPAYFMR